VPDRDHATGGVPVLVFSEADAPSYEAQPSSEAQPLV